MTGTRKEKEILKRQKELQTRVDLLQNDLNLRLLEDYLPDIWLDAGNLRWSTHNISLLRDVDDYVDELKVSALIWWLYEEFLRMGEISLKSFTDRGFKVKTDVLTLLERQIGFRDGKIVKGGYLDSLSRQEDVKLSIKNYIMASLGEGKPYKQFVYGFRQLIKGEDGVLQKYYRTFASDVFAQVTRITDLKLAEELELEHFIYSGGLIETSRQFCIKKDGMAFKKSDAELWRRDPDLPGRDSSFAYNPLVDLGRWRCRHHLEWITKEDYDIRKSQGDGDEAAS